MERAGLALPPISLYYRLLCSVEEGCFSSRAVIVGWVYNVPTAFILYKCNPNVAFFHFHVSSLSASPTIPPIQPLELFFRSLTLLCLPATPSPPVVSLPPSSRPGPVLRFCQEIETDRRVKRVSCRAAAAAAEALLHRGCDLDNQEELERSQALEPLQLQQCQEGVSCVTQCPI